MEAGSSSSTAKPVLRPGTVVYGTDPYSGNTQAYTCGRCLGEGGFARCMEVSDGTKSFALKAVSRASLQKPKNLEKLHTEIAIHRRMKHKHIVNFYESFKDKNFVYMLLEKCDCGTVKDLIKARPLTVDEAQYVMLQCLSATQYMHKNNVIHRDLKPGNIMLDSSLNVKIGDFGLATEMQFDGERKRTICGTPNYMAPEIIERSGDGHSFEVDTWSLGVILYTMLVGDPPFQMEDVQSTYRRIRQGIYEFPPHVSDVAQDLIRCMLSSTPSNRPTLIDIRTHPFFASPPPPMMTPLSLLSIAKRYGHRSASRRQSGAAIGHAPATEVASPPPQQQQIASPLPESNMNENRKPRNPVLILRDENQANLHRDAGQMAKAGESASSGTATYYTANTRHHNAKTSPRITRSSGTGSRHTAAPPLPRSGQTAGGVAEQITRTAFTAPKPQLKGNNEEPIPAPTVLQRHSGGGSPCRQTSAPLQGLSDRRKSSLDNHQRKRSVSCAAAAEQQPPSHLPARQASMGELRAAELDDLNPASTKASVPRPLSTASLLQPTVWVKRCADFTRKYGFCYLLSNKVVGAMYNDITKLFWDLSSDKVVYIVRVRHNVDGGDGEDGAKRYNTDYPTWYSLPDCPETLTKKITLIKYFKSFLMGSGGRKEDVLQCSGFSESDVISSRQAATLPPPGSQNWVYVKGWAKVENTYIFRFSNKSVQVCFPDGSEMFFFWQMELVTYRQPATDTEGVVQRTLPISEVQSESKLSIGLRHIRAAFRFHDMF